jgi:thiol-disulfide isomerase/thioredoxin
MNLSSSKLFRKISPIFEQLSKAHSSISFVKIDIDDFPVISSKYGVKNIPTFCFISEGKTSFEVLLDSVISHHCFYPPVTYLFPPPSTLPLLKFLQFTGAAESLLVDGVKKLEKLDRM